MNSSRKMHTIGMAACLALLMQASLVFGQAPAADSTKDKPQPPWIAPTPERAQWKVIYTERTGDKPKSDVLRRVIKEMNYTKTSPVACLEILWSDGSRVECWLVDGYAIIQPTGNRNIRVISSAEMKNGYDDGYLDFFNQFPRFDWLSLECYDRVQTMDGKRCFHYIDTKLNSEAWIEIQSNLPVARRVGDIFYKYVFLPLPDKQLEVPEKFRTFLFNYKKAGL